MRDLIVKINTDSLDRDDSVGSFTDHDDSRPMTAGSSIHRGGNTDDGSDSGTAGSLSGPSLWPDLEVLDPDHPM